MLREKGNAVDKTMHFSRERHEGLLVRQAWGIALLSAVPPGLLAVQPSPGAAVWAARLQPLSPYMLLAHWLTNPYVAALLFSLGLLGLVVEGLTPGFGAAGTAGLLFLALFFAAHALVGDAGWWAFALVLSGLLLLVVEVFVPGFGIFGFLGLGSIAGAVFLVSPTVAQGVTTLTAAVLVVGCGVFFIIRAAGQGRGLWRRLALDDRLTTEGGYTAQSPPADLVGQRGVTITVLRPAGTARLSGEPRDVVSEGKFIGPGVAVKVVAVAGNRIVVREVSGEEPSSRG